MINVILNIRCEILHKLVLSQLQSINEANGEFMNLTSSYHSNIYDMLRDASDVAITDRLSPFHGEIFVDANTFEDTLHEMFSGVVMHRRTNNKP